MIQPGLEGLDTLFNVQDIYQPIAGHALMPPCVSLNIHSVASIHVYRLQFLAGSHHTMFVFTPQSAAPSGAPTDFQAQALSSTSLQITWNPPEALERNGIITGYEILLVDAQNGTTRLYIINIGTLSFQIEGILSIYIILYMNHQFKCIIGFSSTSVQCHVIV